MYYTCKIEYLYNIYLKIIQYNIETINFKESPSEPYGFESHPMFMFN